MNGNDPTTIESGDGTPQNILQLPSFNMPDFSDLREIHDHFVKQRLETNPELMKSAIAWENDKIRAAFEQFLKKEHAGFSIKLDSLKQESEKFTQLQNRPELTDTQKQECEVNGKKSNAIWEQGILPPIRLKAIDAFFAKRWIIDRIMGKLEQYYCFKEEEKAFLKEFLGKLPTATLGTKLSEISNDKNKRLQLLEHAWLETKKIEERLVVEKIIEQQANPEPTTKKEYTYEKVVADLTKKRKHVSKQDVLRALRRLEDSKEKLQILKEFVPNLSLEDILWAGIVEREFIEKNLTDLVWEQLIKQEWLEQKNPIKPSGFSLNELTLSNILIPLDALTTEWLFTLSDIERIIKKNPYVLADATKVLDEIVDEIQQGEYGELTELGVDLSDNNKNLHNDLVSAMWRKLSIPGIQSFQKGNYMMFEMTDPSTQETSVRYFKIKDINIFGAPETKGTKIIDITGPISNSTIKEPTDEERVTTDMLSYIQIYELLKYARNTTTIRFFDKIGFQNHQRTAWLEEYPDGSEEWEIETVEDLKKLLELEDPEGMKWGLEEGTCFTFDTGEGDTKGSGTCRIIKIKDGKMEITNAKSQDWTNIFSFREFFAAFKFVKAKRIANFTDKAGFLQFLQQNASDDIKKGFKDVALTDGELYMGTEKDAPKVEYLLGKDAKVIKILQWSGPDDVLIQTDGEMEEIKKEKDKKTGIQKTDRPITFKSKPRWTKIETLYKEINAIDAKPFKEPIVEKPTKTEQIEKLDREFSLISFLGSKPSINQLLNTFKYPKDSILKYLKRNDEVHSARAALALYGPLLPENFRKRLEKTVDSAAKKSAEEYMEFITGWPHVKQILKTKNMERFEYEGAMLYTLKKAGTLYPEDLKDLQYINGKPTYAWYTILGWNPNDTLFLDVKRECETNTNAQGEPDPIPFTEERLVEKLLKVQGSPMADIDKPEKNRAKYGIKYRWRGGLDKDFAAAKAEGIKVGAEDWEKSIAEQVTVAGKLDAIIDAMKKGKYAAAFWGLSKLLESHGKREEMYKASILIALSGIGAKLDKEVTAKLPSFSKYPYPPLLFMTSPGDIKLFQEICLRLADTFGKKGDLETALKEGSMEDRVKKLAEFLSGTTSENKNVNSLLSEMISGHDKKHIIFAGKSSENSFYQFYTKVADKTKEHRTNTDAAEKRVYTKKHSSLFWYDQSSEYIGNLKLDQTTDLDDDNPHNKKFKDALDTYQDILKEVKKAKTPEEKEALRDQFMFVFERVYIPARLALGNRKNRSELRFVAKMREAGLDLMATNGWHNWMLEAKNIEFKKFASTQWEDLVQWRQETVSATVQNKKMTVDNIVTFSRRYYGKKGASIPEEANYEQASGF